MAELERKMPYNSIFANLSREQLVKRLQEQISTINESFLVDVGWLANRNLSDIHSYNKYYGQALWELCEHLKTYPELAPLINEAMGLDKAILTAIQRAAKNPKDTHAKAQFELQNFGEKILEKFSDRIPAPNAITPPIVKKETHSSTAMVLTRAVSVEPKKTQTKNKADSRMPSKNVEKEKSSVAPPIDKNNLKELKSAQIDLRRKRRNLQKNLVSFLNEIKKARADKLSGDLIQMKKQANLSVLAVNFVQLQQQIKKCDDMVSPSVQAHAKPFNQQLRKAKHLILKINQPKGRTKLGGLVSVRKKTSPSGHLSLHAGMKSTFDYYCRKTELQMLIAANPILLDFKNVQNIRELSDKLFLFLGQHPDTKHIDNLIQKINEVNKFASDTSLPDHEKDFCNNIADMGLAMKRFSESLKLPALASASTEARLVQAAQRFGTLEGAIQPDTSVTQEVQSESHFQPRR